MKRNAYFAIVLISLWGAGCSASHAGDDTKTPNEAREKGSSSMADESMMRDLFDRWERVWHEGQYDLIPGCVGQSYIRHDENGDRTVTREAYAAELAAIRQE